MESPLGDYFDEFTRRDWQTLDPAAVDDPVRIALVGLGWFTREWALPGIRRSAFTEATVVTDVDADAVAAVADGTDLRGVSATAFREGAAADDYDAVYVATPNVTHLPYVETAAARGKAVLCEKPLEATVERAERAVAACEDAGVPLMVGYRMQTDPAVRRVRDLLAAGFVGDVVHVHANMSQTMLAELDASDQWRLDPDRSGGGALVDLGIYPINTARFVLDADPVRVDGHTRSETPAFADVDEHVSFDLTFPGGVRAHCTASQNAAHASRLEVTGTEGRLILDPAFYEREDREVAVERGGVRADVEFEAVHQLVEEFAYFGHHTLAGLDHYPDGRHALTDVRTIDAVYDAADAGRPVEVGERPE
jgi:xylose dehydrogenase (NAD/NADP)